MCCWTPVWRCLILQPREALPTSVQCSHTSLAESTSLLSGVYVSLIFLTYASQRPEVRSWWGEVICHETPHGHANNTSIGFQNFGQSSSIYGLHCCNLSAEASTKCHLGQCSSGSTTPPPQQPGADEAVDGLLEPLVVVCTVSAYLHAIHCLQLVILGAA